MIKVGRGGFCTLTRQPFGFSCGGLCFVYGQGLGPKVLLAVLKKGETKKIGGVRFFGTRIFEAFRSIPPVLLDYFFLVWSTDIFIIASHRFLLLGSWIFAASAGVLPLRARCGLKKL